MVDYLCDNVTRYVYSLLASVPALSCRSGVANKIYCKALSYIIRSHTQHASQWTFSIA